MFKMMKLEIKSNFNFINLIRHIQKSSEFGDSLNKHITSKIISDSKNKIRSNEVKPRTSDVTLKRRRARKNPPTISDSTLYDTGKLHDSLKLTNVDVHPDFKRFGKTLKNIQMIYYGQYHQFPNPRNRLRKFIEISEKNALAAQKEIIDQFNVALRRKR